VLVTLCCANSRGSHASDCLYQHRFGRFFHRGPEQAFARRSHAQQGARRQRHAGFSRRHLSAGTRRRIQRAVNEIFASIASDRRHRDIDVLHRGPGFDQRVFGDWSMGFADFTGAADILKGFVRLNEQLRIRELDGSQAIVLLATCGAEDEIKSAGA
jgi:Sensors of blue-light using FAD